VKETGARLGEGSPLTGGKVKEIEDFREGRKKRGKESA